MEGYHNFSFSVFGCGNIYFGRKPFFNGIKTFGNEFGYVLSGFFLD